MMEEEPSRYQSLTGGTAYGTKPYNSQIIIGKKIMRQSGVNESP
jgi:hypothetical protein